MALVNCEVNNRVAVVTLNDPGNHVWTLQSSTNFANWNDVDVWKVFNGNFNLGVSASRTTRT